MLKLYNFFRSGTSHRTRIALNLKGVDYQYIPISLGKGEHHSDTFKAINPQELVPALVLDDGEVLTQSVAIIEWLEEVYPDQALLPKDPIARANVRALAAIVGCDIHPINNKRILGYLRSHHIEDEHAIEAWTATWIHAGFRALEALLVQDSTRHTGFCYGDTPTLADAYLIPQVYSARRFNVDLSAYPNIVAIDAHCNSLDAFKKAYPDNQPDAPKA
ncbi:maleylacetoacetate isomerase [uncultured Moraxella sp.]|uniref:maleylacetoacetate isomerase n=1 Tax=uncultured Moraxella sp. TaxID=263769 RepID=UPI0025DB0F63|nr:maleylacetoacetate isomerase [uncultured Moraxella sp.]